MVGMITVREPIRDCLTESLVLSKIYSCRSINPHYFILIFVTIWYLNPAQVSEELSLSIWKKDLVLLLVKHQQGMCLIVLFLAKSMHAKYMPSTINHIYWKKGAKFLLTTTRVSVWQQSNKDTLRRKQFSLYFIYLPTKVSPIGWAWFCLDFLEWILQLFQAHFMMMMMVR